jgi:hypothetical protein
MPNQILRMVANGNESQIALFHDSLSAAIQTAINAIGGSKRVAAELWPGKSQDVAYARLRHALQDDRDEKLSPDEVLYIARKAALVGCHAIPEFYGEACGYEFRPLDPDEAKRRAKKARKAQLLAELSRLMDDDE